MGVEGRREKVVNIYFKTVDRKWFLARVSPLCVISQIVMMGIRAGGFLR